eukprot:TRINITY_DN14679_c0_g4_i1.p1 TRINITY_DN14679_c0_g4~~TRINITY_DN14679_c0_g4_i1.p1  ORF type:complete len:288 (+),score=69.92 TRINITY_DN14679_c0_g4_i1:55-864(+)
MALLSPGELVEKAYANAKARTRSSSMKIPFRSSGAAGLGGSVEGSSSDNSADELTMSQSCQYDRRGATSSAQSRYVLPVIPQGGIQSAHESREFGEVDDVGMWTVVGGFVSAAVNFILLLRRVFGNSIEAPSHQSFGSRLGGGGGGMGGGFRSPRDIPSFDIESGRPQVIAAAAGRSEMPVGSIPPAISAQIVRRVEQLEKEVVKLASKPTSPATSSSEWPKPALDRVSALETELADTKKTLKEVLLRQKELWETLDRMKDRIQPRCWG